MYATSLAEVQDSLAQALEGAGLPIHRGPVPANPVQAPCILLAVPNVTETDMAPHGCTPPAHYEMTVDMLVIASDTTGKDLLTLADTVLLTLVTAGYEPTSVNEQVYDTPNSPAPLPGVQITVE